MKVSNNKKVASWEVPVRGKRIIPQIEGSDLPIADHVYSVADKATVLNQYVSTLSETHLINDAELLMKARQLQSLTDEIRDHLNKNYIWD